jgi:hypothetical protein
LQLGQAEISQVRLFTQALAQLADQYTDLSSYGQCARSFGIVCSFTHAHAFMDKKENYKGYLHI